MKKTITASELAAEQSGEEGVSVGVGVSVIPQCGCRVNVSHNSF
jgi:hypothetical protein